jgi:copper transport protein
VELRYSEPVGTSLGAVRVLAPDGTRVDTGRVTTRDEGRTVVAPLRPGLEAGTYTLLWRVVSRDSHPVTGASTFSVGHHSDHGAAADLAPAEGGNAAGDLLTASRLVLFTGAGLLVGGVAFLLVLWPAGRADRVARRVLWTGWGLALTGTRGRAAAAGPYAAACRRPAVRRRPAREVVQTRFGVASAVRCSCSRPMVPLLLGLARWGRGLLAAGWAVLSAGVLSARRQWGTPPRATWSAWPCRRTRIHSPPWRLARRLVLLGLVVLRRSTTSWRRSCRAGPATPPTAVGVLVVTGTFASWREVRELAR